LLGAQQVLTHFEFHFEAMREDLPLLDQE